MGIKEMITKKVDSVRNAYFSRRIFKLNEIAKESGSVTQAQIDYLLALPEFQKKFEEYYLLLGVATKEDKEKEKAYAQLKTFSLPEIVAFSVWLEDRLKEQVK